MDHVSLSFHPSVDLVLLPPLGWCEECCCKQGGGGRISVHGPAFSSYGHVPKSGVAGSYGNSNSNISRTCQTVFHSGCTILHSHQPCTRGSNFSKSCTDTCSFLFFVRIAILMGVRGTSLWFWVAFPSSVMLSIFSHACWPFLHLFWRNVLLKVLFPSFKLNYLFFGVVELLSLC